MVHKLGKTHRKANIQSFNSNLIDSEGLHRINVEILKMSDEKRNDKEG